MIERIWIATASNPLISLMPHKVIIHGTILLMLGKKIILFFPINSNHNNN